MRVSHLKFALLIFICLFFFSGCGWIDYFFMKPTVETPQDFIEAGNRAMQNKDYNKAIKYYTKLRERYPFSPYTSQAELGLADAYYLDEQYLAAEDAYKEYESLHPGSDNIPYVLFQIGLSNFKQFKSIDLPQDNIDEALQYFNRVSQSYPQTKYAAQAEEYIVKCKKFQAQHELYVADFYWRKEHFMAAWKRYEYVVEHYPDLQDIYQYASKRSRLAYYKYQETKSAQTRRAQKGSWKDWFEWL